jgi:hypothetical protein
MDQLEHLIKDTVYVSEDDSFSEVRDLIVSKDYRRILNPDEFNVGQEILNQILKNRNFEVYRNSEGKEIYLSFNVNEQFATVVYGDDSVDEMSNDLFDVFGSQIARDKLEIVNDCFIYSHMGNVVYQPGKTSFLSSLEGSILSKLILAKGNFLSVEAITASVYGDTSDNARIQVRISGIRAQIGEGIIETKRGFGYGIL